MSKYSQNLRKFPEVAQLVFAVFIQTQAPRDQIPVGPRLHEMCYLLLSWNIIKFDLEKNSKS